MIGIVSGSIRFIRQRGLRVTLGKIYSFLIYPLFECVKFFILDLKYKRGFSALSNLISDLKFYYTNLVLLSYRFPEKRLAQSPIYSLIEVTSFCNIKCQICPRQAYLTRPDGTMSFDLYKKIIDQLSENVRLLRLALHFSGEPLIHPDLGKMIAYAKKKGVFWIKFNSNGTLLNEKKSLDLLKSGLDSILFALEVNQEYHDKFRQGSNYMDVVNKIKTLMQLKRKLKAPKPSVKVIMLITKHMDPVLIAEAEKFWTPIVDRVEFASISTGGGEIQDYGALGDGNSFCWEIYLAMHFLWDGRVIPCCYDHNADLAFGNIKEKSVKELYHSDYLQKLRKMDRIGDYSFHEKCQKCRISQGL